MLLLSEVQILFVNLVDFLHSHSSSCHSFRSIILVPFLVVLENCDYIKVLETLLGFLRRLNPPEPCIVRRSHDVSPDDGKIFFSLLYLVFGSLSVHLIVLIRDDVVVT